MLQVDHFSFQVSDLDKAIKFYTEAFGLNLLFRDLDQQHHEAYAFFELAGASLELVQVLDKDNKPVAFEKHDIKEPYCPHLALKTEDMDQLVEAAETRHISIVKGPLENPIAKWIYLSDPDNNIIEFVQWL